jgi:enoyl-CoA hydratase/carnithine racemase
MREANENLVLADDPRPGIRRLTLNRPEKRNAMSNELRVRLFELLRDADGDNEVRVIIIRGSGKAFSAGYDLGRPRDTPKTLSHHSAIAPVYDGYWARHVITGWFEMWDYATPIIAQVHGYCLAGGTELATAADLVYVADDAQIGYPPTRLISPPDMMWQPWLLGLRKAMEAVLTGDAMTGTEAAAAGFANKSFPAEELEERVLEIAARVALVPPDIQACNKRAVHRSMEIMGLREGVRAASDIQAVAMRTRSSSAYMRELAVSVTDALTHRDAPFGDYRVAAARDAEK